MLSKKREFTLNFGLKYFRELDKRLKDYRVDEQVYLLDINERKTINRIGRQAIGNAFSIGVFTSLVSTIVLFSFGKNIIGITEYINKENIDLLITIGIVTIVTSVLEMIFLFFDGLKKAHKIARAAHLDLFPNKETFIAQSIVRAALELPNPKKNEYGINPRKELVKIKSLFKNVVYKIKASASVLIFKLFIKKMLGKAIGRAYLSIVSIPVIGFWNALETWLIIKEIKIRILGPSAVTEFVDIYNDFDQKLSDIAQLQVLRAVASCIVSTETMHPNLEFLYEKLELKCTIETKNKTIDDTKLFLSELNCLSKEEQKLVIYILEFAAIIDGKIKFKERKLLEKAFQVCGFKYKYQVTKELRNKFISGQFVNWDYHTVTR